MIPADLGPADLGQHQIQQDQVGVMAPEGIDRLPPVGGLDYREALLLQALGQRLAQRALVVDHQNRSSHPGVPSYGAAAACASSFSIARSSRASVRS